ncbi:unnamed protein product [Polarella glacialis]|uniref:ABC1 atypical kinase-like domain-containing protein n=1 Tax=Polarella glacialis TaxID=89957 RepID=A0A813HQ70_POLGL|nr:unnamed protein product [Polarella glacialis]
MAAVSVLAARRPQSFVRSIHPRSSRALLVSLLCALGAICAAISGAFCHWSGPHARNPQTRSGSRLGRSATAPASDSVACPLTGRSPEALAADALKLLQEIGDVTMSTGLDTALSRSFEAARAVALTAAEVVREPPEQFDEAFAARVLRQLFERLGPTYIKLGQFIASSPTVFPAAYVKEFQTCLDSTSKIPFEEVKRIVEAELGKPLTSVYSYFDPVPLAAASIAQVHAAKLRNKNGGPDHDVVVKVQKPGMDEVLKTDLGFVYLAARVLEFINPDLNIRGSLADIASDLRTSMLGELDFRQEQRNLDVFRKFLADNNLTEIAVAPMPFVEASSRRVLTMERLRGVPLVDLEGIKRYTDDPERTLVNALNVWSLSVQSCEFFHADVHAGNLMVLEDGRVGFIDFGIVGRLSPIMATAIDDISVALADSDAKGVARALISMGATVGKVDEVAFAADIQKLITRLGDASGNGTQGVVDESQIQDVVLDIAQAAKSAGSMEISLLGKHTRNSAATAPIWVELSESDSCWTRRVRRASTYSEAVDVTQSAIPGANSFVAKNIVNVIYDVDIALSGTLFAFRDRETAPPVVGPGPRAGVGWLTASGVRCKDQAGCSAFLGRVTTALRPFFLSLRAGDGRPLWQGEFSPTQVQLHACAMHRWAQILRLGMVPKWGGCRTLKAQHILPAPHIAPVTIRCCELAIWAG